MSNYRIRHAHFRDATQLAPVLRAADRAEIYATSGREPVEALKQSIYASQIAYAAEDQDGCFALFGCSSPSAVATVGHPWLLGADRLTTTHRRMFVAETKRFLAAIRTRFDFLVNYVDARNTTSIHWLQRNGFTIFEPEPWGVLGAPFHRFEWRTDNHVS